MRITKLTDLRWTQPVIFVDDPNEPGRPAFVSETYLEPGEARPRVFISDGADGGVYVTQAQLDSGDFKLYAR